MAFFKRDNLIYYDYSWSAYADDDSKVTGEPDSTLLNRKEGYEILYFINKYCEIHSITNTYVGKQLERAVRKDVPSEIRSQKKIMEWLENNLN